MRRPLFGAKPPGWWVFDLIPILMILLVIPVVLLDGATTNAVFASPGDPVLAALEGRSTEPGRNKPNRRLTGGIQVRLAEIGLYTGPTVGEFNPETAAAIRAYQKQTQLPVDGRSSQGLLDHLNSAVEQARRLLRRLNETRRRQILIARKALDAGTRTRELLETRYDRAAAERRQAACSQSLTSACLIDQAYDAANLVKKTDLRDWAFVRLAGAWAFEGDEIAAFGVAAQISDARLIMTALARIARAQTQGGQRGTALETTVAIPDHRLRAGAYLDIATDQQLANDTAVQDTLSLALNEIRNVPDPRHRVSLMTRAAILRAKGGDGESARQELSKATQLARKSDYSIDRDRVLGQVAAAQAQLGFMAAALETTAMIKLPRYSSRALSLVATRQAKDGKVKKALRTADGIGRSHLRVTTLAKVAIAQVRGNDASGGRKTLGVAQAAAAAVPRGYSSDYVQAVLAGAFASFGLAREAVELAKGIEDGLLRVRAMWSISKIQNRLGDGHGASRTKALAMETARAIKTGLERSWALSDIALGWKAAGNIQAARTTLEEAIKEARSLRSAWYRARALIRVAETLAILDNRSNRTLGGPSPALESDDQSCPECRP